MAGAQQVPPTPVYFSSSGQFTSKSANPHTHGPGRLKDGSASVEEANEQMRSNSALLRSALDLLSSSFLNTRETSLGITRNEDRNPILLSTENSSENWAVLRVSAPFIALGQGNHGCH